MDSEESLKSSNYEIFNKLNNIHNNWINKIRLDIFHKGREKGEKIFEAELIKYIGKTISELEILSNKILKRLKDETNKEFRNIYFGNE